MVQMRADERRHVALLGDSIFDNGVYVPGCPDVATQVRALLPQDWHVSLLAVDGAVVDSVENQLSRLTRDTSHIVISAGGNDALGASGILSLRSDTVADALGRLAALRDAFDSSYNRMLSAVLERGVPTAVCTIYDSNYPEPERKIIVAALTLFNDVITRAAFSRGLPLIDLRLICNDPADYANPIEPSARGGRKIASAIAALVTMDRWNDDSVVIAEPR